MLGEIGAEIMLVLEAIEARMSALEAKVLSGNDLISSLWRAMQDFTLETKQAMLQRLEILVESEAATHHPLQ